MIAETVVWTQVEQAMNALAPFYQDQAVADLQKLEANHAWLPLLKTAGTTPAPLSAEQFATAVPYTASRQRHEMLQEAVARGLLAVDRAGRYRLTEHGKKVLAAFFDSAQAAIAAVPALPAAEMEELVALLERVVLAVERSPLPREKSNFAASRWTDPGPDAPLTVRADQYMTDLMHFRQDAHIASWNAYGVDGIAWETFTLIWRNQANTTADLAHILSSRGHDEADYAAALRLLADKGWIEQAAGRWQISGSGQALRDVAEMVTNRLFFAAWRVLGEIELCRLSELLVSLSRGLIEARPAIMPAS